MNAVGIAGLVLVALLVGAALPLLAQARVSLRTWERVREEAGPGFNRRLEEVSDATARVRPELAALDGGGQRVASALGAAGELG